MPRIFPLSLVVLALGLSACTRLAEVGQVPAFQSPVHGNEVFAMNSTTLPTRAATGEPQSGGSVWQAGQSSFLGNRRAARRGDILTVVIEIDDSASMTNASQRARNGAEQMSLPQFLGLPQRIDRLLPEGANMGQAVNGNGASTFAGSGNVRRREELTLRVAATVIDVMANGTLRIEGTQEVRVNYEIRELLVTGFVRPGDISRSNEITYDRIAGARISYGGRGVISDMQQPRYGQQIADIILPF